MALCEKGRWLVFSRVALPCLLGPVADQRLCHAGPYLSPRERQEELCQESHLGGRSH